eukprot:TRINITY_DN114754_c0_g1_i1.p1 TRINITY_DN114754_c0_g1~~TRINITY_DN114754_c0_g1_i1.p1  ORF type:complete len:258 (+),score=32.34 TRINITY_DN114754_c0_g1_i1:84-857(+)
MASRSLVRHTFIDVCESDEVAETNWRPHAWPVPPEPCLRDTECSQELTDVLKKTGHYLSASSTLERRAVLSSKYTGSLRSGEEDGAPPDASQKDMLPALGNSLDSATTSGDEGYDDALGSGDSSPRSAAGGPQGITLLPGSSTLMVCDFSGRMLIPSVMSLLHSRRYARAFKDVKLCANPFKSSLDYAFVDFKDSTHAHDFARDFATKQSESRGVPVGNRGVRPAGFDAHIPVTCRPSSTLQEIPVGRFHGPTVRRR